MNANIPPVTTSTSSRNDVLEGLKSLDTSTSNLDVTSLIVKKKRKPTFAIEALNKENRLDSSRLSPFPLESPGCAPPVAAALKLLPERHVRTAPPGLPLPVGLSQTQPPPNISPPPGLESDDDSSPLAAVDSAQMIDALVDTLSQVLSRSLCQAPQPKAAFSWEESALEQAAESVAAEDEPQRMSKNVDIRISTPMAPPELTDNGAYHDRSLLSRAPAVWQHLKQSSHQELPVNQHPGFQSNFFQGTCHQPLPMAATSVQALPILTSQSPTIDVSRCVPAPPQGQVSSADTSYSGIVQGSFAPDISPAASPTGVPCIDVKVHPSNSRQTIGSPVCPMGYAELLKWPRVNNVGNYYLRSSSIPIATSVAADQLVPSHFVPLHNPFAASALEHQLYVGGYPLTEWRRFFIYLATMDSQALMTYLSSQNVAWHLEQQQRLLNATQISPYASDVSASRTQSGAHTKAAMPSSSASYMPTPIIVASPSPTITTSAGVIAQSVSLSPPPPPPPSGSDTSPFPADQRGAMAPTVATSVHDGIARRRVQSRPWKRHEIPPPSEGRFKQIARAKATPEYLLYTTQVPVEARNPLRDPMTPRIEGTTWREFQQDVRSWKRALHRKAEALRS